MEDKVTYGDTDTAPSLPGEQWESRCLKNEKERGVNRHNLV